MGRTILVTDDIGISRQVLRQLLGEAYTVQDSEDVQPSGASAQPRLLLSALLDEAPIQREIGRRMSVVLEGGAFEPWFQPQYNHVTGALTGAEALVRWRLPDGYALPGEFLPVFERTGLLYQLDRQVREQVCGLLHRWLERGLTPPPVSVNLARQELLREDFFAAVTGLVERFCLPAALLRLEVSQCTLVSSDGQVLPVLQRLAAYGFTVMMDGFGGGTFCLHTLTDLPTALLKLDVGFLKHTGNAGRGGAILEGVVRMARWLDMPVMAEGVETKAQADFLASIGCHELQGWLYARPMPAKDFTALVCAAPQEDRHPPQHTVPGLDGSAFWDPEHLQTLLFNNYAGGACILEYHNGKIELLRANDSYLRELGLDSEADVPLSRLEPGRYLNPEDQTLVEQTLLRAIQTGAEQICEVRAVGLNPTRADTWVRSTIRYLAQSGDRYLLYCSVVNLTAEKHSRQELRERDELLRFLNDTAHDLLALADPVQGIQTVLHKLLDYFGGSRVVIFQFDSQHKTASGTFQVCADGNGGQDLPRDMPQALVDFWLHAFDQANHIDLRQANRLGPEEAEEPWLPALGVQSLVAVPLRRDGVLQGFIRVDEPSRRWEEIARLEAIGDYIAMVLTRQELTAKIRSDNETLLSLMNDTPGGFVRMQVLPGGGVVPVYFNEGFCRLVGMNRDALMALYGNSSMAGVHPDDLTVVQEAVKRLLDTGDAYSEKYRLLHADGSYVWVMFFGRVTKNEAGQAFLNIYYTEPSAQVKRELSLQQTLPYILSAMMESSTDLSFAKDRELRYLCCSREFARMVGLASAKDVVGKTDYQLFDREIADKYRADDVMLMTGGQSIVDMVELIPSDDGVAHYSSTSKYLLYDTTGSVIGLYGVGRDITEYRAAFEQLRLLTNSIPGGLATYELSTAAMTVRYFSDNYFTHTGYTREEYKARAGEDPQALVFPEDKPTIAQACQKILTGADDFSFEYRAYTKDGSYRWLHVQGVVIERHEDTAMVNVVKLDITHRRQAEALLRLSEELYRLAQQQSGSIMYCYSAAACCAYTQLSEEGLRGGIHIDRENPVSLLEGCVVLPESQPDYRTAFLDLDQGRGGQVKLHMRSEDGASHWFDMRYSVLDAEDDAARAAVISFTDITGAHERELAYQRYIESIQDSARQGQIVYFDTDLTANVVESVGGAVPNITFPKAGCRHEEAVGGGIVQLLTQSVRGEAWAFFSREHLITAYADGVHSLAEQWPAVLPDNTQCWFQADIQMIQDPYSDHLRAYTSLRDITREKQQTLEAQKRSQQDGLTGVYNRATMEAGVRQRLEETGGLPCALLIVDLDDLKTINDTLGHPQGDRAIRQIAQTLQNQFRQSDLVGRIGGDEFLVFLEGIWDLGKLEAITASILRRIAGVRIGPEDSIPISVSIGVATRQAGDTFDSLYQKADRALYTAKGRGKQQYAFWPRDTRPLEQ